MGEQVSGFEFLNEASFLAPTRGLFGEGALGYYRVLASGVLSQAGVEVAWNGLVKWALETFYAALPVRLWKEAGERLMRGAPLGDVSLFEGHLLQRVCRDYARGARAYLRAGRYSWSDALAAAISLRCLYRLDPQQEETRLALTEIQDGYDLRLVSKREAEARLSAVSARDVQGHVRAVLDLVLALLVEWGDIPSALDWLETVASSGEAVDQIGQIAGSVGRAALGQGTVLSRVVTILETCGASEEIGRIARLSRFYRFCGNGECMPDLAFSRILALSLHDEAGAIAHWRLMSSSAVGGTFAQIVRGADWIFGFASGHVSFAEAVVASCEYSGDDEIEREVLDRMWRLLENAFSLECGMRLLERLCANGDVWRAVDIGLALSGRIWKAGVGMMRRFSDVLIDLAEESRGDEFLVCRRKLAQIAQEMMPFYGEDETFLRFLEAAEIDALDGMDEEHAVAVCAKKPPEAFAVEASRWLGMEPSALCGSFADAMEEMIHLECITGGDAAEIGDMRYDVRLGEKQPIVILGLGYILDPEMRIAPWRTWLEARVSMGDSCEACWTHVVEMMLRYMRFSVHRGLLGRIILEICRDRLSRDVAADLLCHHFTEGAASPELMDWIIEMAENTNCQRQMLEKLDEAISVYADDVVQKNALCAKKYRIGELLGDERVKLASLREILETTPNDPFANSELLKIDAGRLKLHTQILYYQLRILVDADAGQRLDHQMLLARLYSRSAQVNNAIDLYHSIIDEHPEALEARYCLLELFESLENWKSAENSLLALINVETSPTRRYQCFVRLADVQYEHMNMPSRAMLTLFAAVDSDPSKLSQLHEKMCEISERSKSYSAQLDKYEDLSVHARIYEQRRMAVILLANLCVEHMKTPELACKHLEAFFEKEGRSDPEFLRVVAEFYEEIRQWDGYVKVETALITCKTDSRERALHALNIARVYAEELNSSARAAQYARLAAQVACHDSDIWRDIARYLAASNAVDDALDALRQAYAHETHAEKRVSILLEISEMYAQGGRLEEAASEFHRLASFHPPLEQLTAVAEELIACATSQRNREIFANLCDDLISCSPTEEQTDLLLQKALTLLRVFEDRSGAREILEKNSGRLESIGGGQSLILAQILTKLGENDAACRGLKTALGRFGFSQEQRFEAEQTLLENAIILDDVDQMRLSANEILKIDTEDALACFTLIRLDFQDGKWDDALSRIMKILPHLERLSADNAMMLHYYYGAILYAAQHFDLAIESLDNALRISTSYRPAVDLKLTILLEHQRWPEALPIFDLLLKLSQDLEEQGAIHKRVAEIYHFYIHNPEKAIREYEQALSLGGDVEDVPVRLLALYQETGVWHKAAMTASVLAQAQVATPSVKAAYLVVLGHLEAYRLGHPEKGINSLLEAFMNAPYERDCLLALLRLLAGQKDWGNIKAIYTFLMDHLPQEPESARAQLIFLAQATGRFGECRAVLEAASTALKRYFPLDDLCMEAERHAVELPNEESAVAPVRRRVNTAPRGRLTYDSSLILHPDAAGSEDGSMDVALGMCDANAEITQPVGGQGKESVEGARRNGALSLVLPQIGKASKKILPSLSSSRLSVIQAFEDLSFDQNTFGELEREAKQNGWRLTLACVHDLMDIIDQDHELDARLPIPETLPSGALQGMIALHSPVLSASLVRLLSALTHPESPAIEDGATFETFAVDEASLKIFDRVMGLFHLEGARLMRRSSSGMMIANTAPVSIFVNSQMLNSQTGWSAYLIAAAVSARPEARLALALPSIDVLEILQNAVVSMNPIRAKSSELPPQMLEQYKNVLVSAGVSALSMPGVTSDSLDKLKQYTHVQRKISLEVALVLSQSLKDCLQMVVEMENIRFPSSLSTLKAAMKQSGMVKSLVKFAVSANARHTFDRIF